MELQVSPPFTVTVGVTFPITADVDRWWFPAGMFGAALLVVLAVWGYRTATVPSRVPAAHPAG